MTPEEYEILFGEAPPEAPPTLPDSEATAPEEEEATDSDVAPAPDDAIDSDADPVTESATESAAESATESASEAVTDSAASHQEPDVDARPLWKKKPLFILVAFVALVILAGILNGNFG